MRIHGAEAIAIDIPLKQNFGGSTYSVLKRCTVITRLRTRDGLASEVYNGDNREHSGEIARIIEDELLPLVKGMSIFEYERIWEKMFALTHASRDRKTLLEAIACMDCAIWDLIGKALGRTVRELLGGYRERLPVISIGGWLLHARQEARGFRQGSRVLPQGRHGGLQVQSRRSHPRGGRETRRRQAAPATGFTPSI